MKRYLHLFIISQLIVFSPSCINLSRGNKFYKSDEFIIYTLKKHDTPALLAEKFFHDKRKAWIIEDANDNVIFRKNKVIIIPLKKKTNSGISDARIQSVPIIAYHRFGDDCNSPLCMSAEIFDNQMRYLQTNGYRTITPSELIDFLNYRSLIPKKSILITIDDGYSSIYHIAYPILKKYGFTATLFIYTDFVGMGRNAITWEQLRKMKSDGFSIGSHTLSHADLTKQRPGEKIEVFFARIADELRLSKRMIDKKLNQDTIFLAFPYGRYNEKVLKMTKNCGYRIAVSVKKGSNSFFADPLALKRSQILKRDMKSFISRIKTFNRL